VLLVEDLASEEIEAIGCTEMADEHQHLDAELDR
jgi:hypothetical protein